MRRLVPLLRRAPGLDTAGAARGDGCAPTYCGVSGSAAPGSRLLVVRPNGSQGALQAYDLVTHRLRFSLPAGILSANGRWFFTAKTRRGLTRLTRFDARTGARHGTWTYRGRWWLQGMSPSGARVVLAQFVEGSHDTHLGVVDHGRLVRRLLFSGSDAVEMLSPNGRLIFLVHYDRTGAGYALQVYDLRTSRLRANPAREVDGSREKMIGNAWSAIATRNGHWLLTLYLKPDGSSFVHALDLTGGTPICVDLPLHGGYGDLQMTSLALSPDEQTLYLANPIVGVVTSLDVRNPHVAKTVHFQPWHGVVEVGVGPGIAVSRDGGTVAFTQDASIWRYDVASGTVKRARDAGSAVAALAYAPSGKLVAMLGSPWRFVTVR